MNNLYKFTLMLVVVGLFGTYGFSQDKEYKYEFCGENNYSYGNKNVVKDLREYTIPATGRIEVDGRKNGGIKVTGENRSDVLVRACVQAWSEDRQEAVTDLNNTRIETSGVIRAENADEEAKFSVSYELIVPIQTDLKLTAKNGGISIRSVEGNLEFLTKKITTFHKT